MAEFLTTDDVMEDLTAMLNKANIQTPARAWWLVVMERGLETSENVIKSHLLKRGYTLAQIKAWSRLHEYHRDIALYWAIIKGNIAERFNTQYIDLLNREWELDNVPIIDEPVTTMGNLSFVMLTPEMKERLAPYIHVAKFDK